MITSSNALQVPLVTVQRAVALDPAANPVMVDVGEPGVVIVALPLGKVHIPFPNDGVLCVIVNVPFAHWL